jgi:hypothetical protein
MPRLRSGRSYDQPPPATGHGDAPIEDPPSTSLGRATSREPSSDAARVTGDGQHASLSRRRARSDSSSDAGQPSRRPRLASSPRQPEPTAAAEGESRILACDRSALAFISHSDPGAEALAELLFEFHGEAMDHSATYRQLVNQAEGLGRIAVHLSGNDSADHVAQTEWVDDAEGVEPYHLVDLHNSNLDMLLQHIPAEERSDAKRYLSIRYFINELNNAALWPQFDAMTQAARRGDYADKVLMSESDPTLSDVERHIAATDRLLARQDHDGPAVHYARETERLEATFVEKLDAVHLEIAESKGLIMRELSPNNSFEIEYRIQVELGHAQKYLAQYDRILASAP